MSGIDIFNLIVSSDHDNACGSKAAIHCGLSGKEFLFGKNHSMKSHSLIPVIKVENVIILFD